MKMRSSRISTFREQSVRYTVRRIGLTSVARLGCMLGWLTALLPALCFAGLAVAVVQRVHQALQQVTPITLSLFGQELIRIDLLEVLRLQPLAQVLARWAENPMLTFFSLALGLTLLGGVFWILTSLLVSEVYNLAARAGWGLVLELREEHQSTTSK